MPDSDPANKCLPDHADGHGAGKNERKKRGDGARNPRNEEIGGANGLEPTRYGDWERNGRCTDF